MNCDVCYESFKEFELVRLGCCTGKFCKECICKCENKKCPQCRTLFMSNSLDELKNLRDEIYRLNRTNEDLCFRLNQLTFEYNNYIDKYKSLLKKYESKIFF